MAGRKYICFPHCVGENHDGGILYELVIRKNVFLVTNINTCLFILNCFIHLSILTESMDENCKALFEAELK